MSTIPYTTALIVGAGPGISASLARALRREGLAVALAARDAEKLSGLVAETGAVAFAAELRQDAECLRGMAADLDARAEGLRALAERQDRDAVSRERAKRAAIAAALQAEGRSFHIGIPGPAIVQTRRG